MFNIVHTGNRVDINSEGVDFAITSSFVSGTAIPIAEIRADGYNWQITPTGTYMVNVELIQTAWEVLGCTSYVYNATSFAQPNLFTTPPALITGSSQLSTSSVRKYGFISENGFVYWIENDRVHRIPEGGGSEEIIFDGSTVQFPETIMVRNPDVPNSCAFIMGIESIAGGGSDPSDYTIQFTIYDFSITGSILIASLPEYDDSWYTWEYNHYVATVNGKLIISSWIDQSDLFTFKTYIYDIGTQTFMGSNIYDAGALGYLPNGSCPPIINGNDVYFTYYMGAPETDTESTPIIIHVNANNYTFSVGRPKYSGATIGALYSGVYDAASSSLAYIYTRVTDPTHRHSGVMLINPTNFSVDITWEVDWATSEPDNMPYFSLKAATGNGYIVKRDGDVVSVVNPESVLTNVPVNAPTNAYNYAQPIYMCNIIDEDDLIWLADSSYLKGYPLFGGSVEVIYNPLGDSYAYYIYLCDGNLIITDSSRYNVNVFL